MRFARSFPGLILLFVLLLPGSMNSLYSNPLAQMTNGGIESLPFKQELFIPIDTGQSKAANQPIDIALSLDHDCWALNDTHHALRVVYQIGSEFVEIESQIYNLSFSKTSIINSCRLVFLIPQGMDGRETYYILYSDKQIAPSRYPDHVSLEESSYYYEPISGQKMDFDYYKVIDDGFIVYGISYQGDLFGHGISQVVARLEPGTTTVDTSKIDIFGSFSMLYSSHLMECLYTGSSLAKNPKKSVIIDGNLMARVFIEGISPEGDIKTSNVYTYYHSPSEPKRMDVLIHHEILKDIDMGGSKALDGTYAYIMAIKARSSSINNLNIGSILPVLQMFGEEDRVHRFEIPTDPRSEIEEMVLCTLDDMDLGNPPWFCVYDPDSKKTHAMIFQTNKNITPGWPDQDGLQVKSFVEQTIKLPGLEVDTGNVYATRNHFDNGGEYRWFLPKGFNVTLHAEFVTFEIGDWEAVDTEARLFQQIASDRHSSISYEGEELSTEKKYDINAYVHGVFSTPFGSALAAISGRNISYITAELHHANSLTSSGSVGRIALRSISTEILNQSLPQKIISLIKSVDWRNGSVFKRIRFNDVPAGQYVIKVFKEHAFFDNQRRFIGYSIVNIQEDTSVHIYCRKESSFIISVIDQHGNKLENVTIDILKDSTKLSESLTDSEGKAIIYIPFKNRESYLLEGSFQGFPLFNKNVSFQWLNRFLPNRIEVETKLHDLSLIILDKWAFTSEVQCHPILKSEKNQNSKELSIKDSIYQLSNIPAGTYHLTFGFKSFQVSDTITIEDDTVATYELPALYNLTCTVYNVYGMPIEEGILHILRGTISKEKTIESINTSIYLPPATYLVEIIDDKNIDARLQTTIRSDKTIEIITNQSSNIHTLFWILGLIITLACVLLFSWRKQGLNVLYCLIIGLLIISLGVPWWTLTGSTGEMETQTNLMLVPGTIVAFTETDEFYAGELQIAPDEVYLALTIFSCIVILSALFFALSLVMKRKSIKISKYMFISSGMGIGIILIGFLYLLSQLTTLGVGTISGEGELSIQVPGMQIYEMIPCSWGPSTGSLLVVLAGIIAILRILFMLDWFKRKWNKIVTFYYEFW
jgi:hypothetical protein